MRPFLLWLLIGFSLAIAWTACSTHLWSEPLWLDERHTQWVADGAWSDLWHRAEIGNQPPLYFAGLKLLSVDSDSEPWFLRLPSVLSYACLIVVIPAMIFRWTGKVSGAAVACSLLVFQNDFWFYATEARPYAVLCAISALQVILVAKRLGLAGLGSPHLPTPATRAAALIASLLLVWLHFTAIVLLVAQAIAGACQVRFDPKRRTERWSHSAAGRDLGIDVAVLVVGILPLTASLWQVGSHRQAWTLFIQPTPEHVEPLVKLIWWTILLPILVVAIDRLTRTQKRKTLAKPIAARTSHDDIERQQRQVAQSPCDEAADSTSSIAVAKAASRKTTTAFVPDTIGLAWFVSASVLIAWGLAGIATFWGTTPLLAERYLFDTWSWLAIASGLWVSTLAGAWTRPMVAVVLAISLVPTPDLENWYRSGQWPVYRTENWRAIVERLNNDRVKVNRVWLYGGIIEETRLGAADDPALEEYLGFPLVGLDPTILVQPIPTIPDAAWPSDSAEQLSQGLRVGIVVRDDPWEPELTRALAQQLQALSNELGQQQRAKIESFGSIRLVILEPK